VYVEYFSAMVDERGMLKKELSEDGLHPNAAGYALMAPLAEKAIQAAVRERAATSLLSPPAVSAGEQTEDREGPIGNT